MLNIRGQLSPLLKAPNSCHFIEQSSRSIFCRGAFIWAVCSERAFLHQSKQGGGRAFPKDQHFWTAWAIFWQKEYMRCLIYEVDLTLWFAHTFALHFNSGFSSTIHCSDAVWCLSCLLRRSIPDAQLSIELNVLAGGFTPERRARVVFKIFQPNLIGFSWFGKAGELPKGYPKGAQQIR